LLRANFWVFGLEARLLVSRLPKDLTHLVRASQMVAKQTLG